MKKAKIGRNGVKKLDAAAIIIQPPNRATALNLKDLWRYRELILFMTWRDIIVRYKQTVLGILWAVLRPILLMVVFSLLFGQLAQLSSEGIPYPLFNFAALLPWQLFAKALSESSRSLTNNSHMITKVYFPRVILPLASVLSGVVDFGIAFVVLIVMMLFYGYTPTWNAFWAVPAYLLLTIISALGIGLWLSALNVMYRDVNYLLEFLVQFWFFLTPITYSSALIPDKWLPVYSLNPMKGVIDGFRWSLLGSAAPGVFAWVSIGVALVLLITGMYYFRKTEQKFADMV